MEIKCLLTLLAFHLVGLTSGVDETLVEKSNGPGVVEAVCSKIESSGMFANDNLFLRRIAYFETNDGLDPKTYREGYHGGIWQVDEKMFNQLHDNADICEMYNLIKKHFNIDWIKTKWSDLRKPFHSGLAARLILHFSKIINFGGSINAQAKLWVTYYRIGGNEASFVKKLNNHTQECESGAVDIIFMVDDSRNIGLNNFKSIKTFIKTVISQLNVGPDEVLNSRLSVVTFSNPLTPIFSLNSFSVKEFYLGAVENMVYGEGDTTNINLVLQYLRLVGFNRGSGAREGVPKLAVILTNGESKNQFQIIKETHELSQSGITILAVGIGSEVNIGELKAIASHPSSSNLFLINGFSDFQHITEVIHLRTCKVPVVVNKNTKATVPRSGFVSCKIILPSKGTTYMIQSNLRVDIYFSDVSIPSSSCYDRKITIQPSSPSVVYIPGKPSFDLRANYVQCLMEGNPEGNTDVVFKPCPGNCDPCDGAPCSANQICVNNFELGYKCLDKRRTTSGYDCMKNNPCTPQNTKQNLFYFPYLDQSKFIQCSEWGQCYIMPCPRGQVWSVETLTCVPLAWYEQGII